MKNRFLLIAYFVFLFMIMFSSEAHAQNKKITYVEKGKDAPFSGVLLTAEAFAELKVKADTKDEEIKLKVDYQVASGLLVKQLEIDNLNTKLSWQEIMWKDRLSLKNQRIDDLYKQLEKEKKKTVWERIKGPSLFISGVAVTLGAVYATSKITNYTITRNIE